MAEGFNMKNELKQNEEISDVPHNEQQRLRTFHLFCGAGGGVLADLLLGHIPVGACEIEDYPRAVLLQRQRDGILPEFPVWDDITTLDGKPWRGLVDVVAGGFPCQDISAAGKGAGIDGDRSGLWGEMARVIDEIRPRFAFVENSPMLTSRGLGVVLGDLAEMGYNARWGVLGADDVGGDCRRKRVWIFARSTGERRPEMVRCKTGERKEEMDGQPTEDGYSHRSYGERVARLEQVCGEPAILGSTNGMADQVVRLKAIGNGQDPRVAATAWKILTEGLI